jgi:hypothetical protein
VHVFEVVATDRAGNADPTPAVQQIRIAASPALATPAPAVTPAPIAAPARLALTLRFTFRALKQSTRFTRLSAVGLPAGAKVEVTVRCPKRAVCPKGFTRSAAAGRALSLSPLLRRALRPGTKVTVRAAATGALPATKVLTIRARRAPALTG